MPYEDLGLWTQAHREDGTSLEGWLWAKTRQGLFLSMDPQGDDIQVHPGRKLITSGHHPTTGRALARPRREIAKRSASSASSSTGRSAPPLSGSTTRSSAAWPPRLSLWASR